METNYVVELRHHFENGHGEDDYTEEDYDFTDKAKAIEFAKKNTSTLHGVYIFVDGEHTDMINI